MSDSYQTGYERLSRLYPDASARYAYALGAVKKHFRGFAKKDGYDLKKLTDSQKRQIRRYYNTLVNYTEGGPVYKMTPGEIDKKIPRTKKNILAVMKAAQMSHGVKRSKYIFVAFDGKNVPRVTSKDGVVVFYDKTMGFYKEIIPLHPVDMATRPHETVRHIMGQIPDAIFYRLTAGKREFLDRGTILSGSLNPDSLADTYVKFMNAYNDPSKNNYYKNWLLGLVVYRGTASDRDIILKQVSERQAWKKVNKKVQLGESFDDYINRRNKELRDIRAGKKVSRKRKSK